MDKTKASRTAVHVLIAIYGIACFWLFYRQSIADLTVKGASPYQSDLPLHISMIVEDGWYYSFTAYIYKLLYVLCGGSTVGIALFLALCAWATVYVMEAFLRCIGNYGEKNWFTLLLALSLHFVMPCFLRVAGEYRYVSYQSGNIWHNSTYLCMRLVALVTLLYYFRLEEKYREGLTWREWVGFALLNLICTGIKPSFLVVFSPIMGVRLFVELFRKVPLKRILVFGSALLPSGLVILWQNAVLFGEDTGNGIGFRPWYTFSLHANMTKLAVVCSVLFCGCVILVTMKQLLTDRKYRFIAMMSVLGFGEALCLVESGTRAVDGNFLWSYSFCLFVLFAVCAMKWLEFGKEGKQRVIRVGLGLVYAWHLYCGLYYFVRLVCGESYWMR